MKEKKWNYEPARADVDVFAAKFNMSEIIAQIIYKKGYQTDEEISGFLNPSLKDLHPPKLLKDIDIAAHRLQIAFENDERILIFGDYDVDGTTATAILYKAFTVLGAKNLAFYIPDRHKEGYGLNKKAITKIADNHDLIVTVDLGITAKAEVELANKLGVDVIVTDHHEPQEDLLPEAYAIINPKQKNCLYPFDELAGCGVAFKLAERLFQIKENNDDFTLSGEYLDLVTLGTIADCVSLTKENRILSKLGIKQMHQTDNLGLVSLINAVGLKNKEISSSDVGFRIAPCINAAGRMAHAKRVVELLITEDPSQAKKIALELNKLNEERKDLVTNQYEHALNLLKNKFDEKTDRVIVLSDKEFDASIAGIVASRLCEKFFVPTIIIDASSGKGSARSIDGISIFEGLQFCSELLDGFGGHTMAAGLTVQVDNVNKLREKLQTWIQKIDDNLFVPEFDVSMQIPLKGASMDLVEQLKTLGPFGEGNSMPIFKTSNVQLINPKISRNKKHAYFIAVKNNSAKKCVWWNIDEDIKETLCNLPENAIVDLLYEPFISAFRGVELQLKLIDVKIKIKEKKNESAKIVDVQDFIHDLFEKKDEILVDDPYRGIENEDCFPSKVVGVTFEDRQELIANLEQNDEIWLEREPDNKFDCNAIKVCANVGQIGYIKGDIAQRLSPLIDKGIEYEVFISEITGGESDEKKENLGVNIVIAKEGVEVEDVALNLHKRRQLAALDEDELIVFLKNDLLGKSKDLFPKQKEGLYRLLQGDNVLQIMGTGRGKSLIFQIYGAYQAIKKNSTSIFFYPLRALINDQFISLKEKMAALGINVKMASGSLTHHEKKELFMSLQENTVDIVLATPEFIEYHIDKFEVSNIGFMVVDEAHHISDKHRKIYSNLDTLRAALSNPQVFACTATAEDDVAQLIVDKLKIDLPEIQDLHIRKNLTLLDRRGLINKESYLIELAKKQEKTIIYTNSRKKTQEIALFLTEELPFINTAFYHGALTSQERLTVEKLFQENKIQILVATSAFGEGVNIPDIKNVVLYHMNFSLTDFTQQAGRAGRNGDPAKVHLIFNKFDAMVNEFILNIKTPERQFILGVYNALSNLKEDVKGPIGISNKDLAQIVKKESEIENILPGHVSSALRILEELNILVKNNNSHDRKIVMVDRQEDSIELLESLCYIEGVKDKDLFHSFRDYILSASAEELLTRINRPVVPVNKLTAD
ncbi:MAG: single-stranded-DNA-specific exonuclease RecJ [bacterium]